MSSDTNQAVEMRALIATLALAMATAACEQAASPLAPDSGPLLGKTQVPGHQGPRYDADDNGYPDEGVTVTGKYTSLYAEDGNGDYYWDLGDGRIQGTVGSVDALDAATLTTCDYQVHYRGTFENDPFMDTGWISNNINCRGADKGTYNYLIVHETDPRYTGDPANAIWGTWEYHVNTQSGVGNLARPEKHNG